MRHCDNLIRATLTTLLMLVALVGAAAAGPLDDAVAAHQRGDYATAVRLIRPLAEQGDAAAQYNLGDAYAHPENFRSCRVGPGNFTPSRSQIRT
jgi:hypothetical protein